MAHVRRPANSKYYHIFWKELRDGRWENQSKATKCRTLKEAKLVLTQWEVERIGKRAGLVVSVPVAGLCDQFLTHEKARQSPKWYKDQALVIEKRIKPKFGDRLTLEVDKSDILEWQTSMIQEGLHPRTCNLYLLVLRKLFNFAIEMGKCQVNPCAKVGDLRLPHERKITVLNAEEIAALLREAKGSRNPHLYAFVVLGVYAGLRSGEMRNLRGRDVDLEHGLLHIQSSAEFRTKTGVRHAVPMHDEVKALFNRECGANELWFPGYWGSVIGDFGKGLALAAKRAGIAKRVTPHVLRHTFATHLRRASDISIVSRALGHRRISTTEIYDHVEDEELRDAVKGL